MISLSDEQKIEMSSRVFDRLVKTLIEDLKEMYAGEVEVDGFFEIMLTHLAYGLKEVFSDFSYIEEILEVEICYGFKVTASGIDFEALKRLAHDFEKLEIILDVVR